MNRIIWTKILLAVIFGFSATSLSVAAKAHNAMLENRFLKRELAVVDGVLTTRSLENKLAKKILEPSGGSEFRLRISEGTDTTGTDVELAAADFSVKQIRKTKEGVVASLKNAEHGLEVEVLYTLAADEPYARKQLKITADKPIVIERIDLEALAFADAHQPYKLNVMNSRGKWSPGLGQPLYTTNSASFWGVEFPASVNTVEEGELRCGYQWGRELKSGEVHTSYKAVVGVGDEPTTMPERTLYWEFGKQAGDPNSGIIGEVYQAARRGPWKAVRYGLESPVEVYNLEADPGENVECSPAHPEIQAEFVRLFEEYGK